MYIKEEFALWFVCKMLSSLPVFAEVGSCYSCRELIVITHSKTQPSFLYLTLLSMGFYTSDCIVQSISLSSASVSLSKLRSKAN